MALKVPIRKKPVQTVSLDYYFTSSKVSDRAELIYGEVVVPPPPSEGHNDLVHDLGEILKRWTREFDLGKVSYGIAMVLDEEKKLSYIPDLLFVRKANEARRRDGRLYGPADLCIEILSGSDRPSRRGRKFADYEHYGVEWYWTILPHPTEPIVEENQLVDGVYQCRQEIVGDAWFEPGLFPELFIQFPPLIRGNTKGAVKGKAKKLV